MNANNKIDIRIQRMLRSYAKEDPPPNRVKPVPIAVLRRIFAISACTLCAHSACLADMIGLAFFFLLRPGEYTHSSQDSVPFELKDVQLFQGTPRLNLNTATDAQLLAASFASLTFDTQKNAVRGEVIGQGHSGDSLLSPTKILARRVIHLRSHGAPPNTPLSSYYDAQGNLQHIKPAHITSALQDAVRFLNPTVLGFLPSDVTARCLRAAGANALLSAQVDSDHIRLLGRWRSDEMLRYLHLQAQPIMHRFAGLMLAGGNFVLIPNQQVPSY